MKENSKDEILEIFDVVFDPYLANLKSSSPTKWNLDAQTSNIEPIFFVTRSFKTKPDDLANTVGSRLKRNCVNTSSSKPEIPVTKLTNSVQELIVNAEKQMSKEDRRRKKQKSCLVYGAASACCGLILLAVILGIIFLPNILSFFLGTGMY